MDNFLYLSFLSCGGVAVFRLITHGRGDPWATAWLLLGNTLSIFDCWAYPKDWPPSPWPWRAYLFVVEGLLIWLLWRETRGRRKRAKALLGSKARAIRAKLTRTMRERARGARRLAPQPS